MASFTLVELSATNTSFVTSSLDAAKPMASYADTLVGEVRHAIAGEAAKWEFDDPHWMVLAIIASVDKSQESFACRDLRCFVTLVHKFPDTLVQAGQSGLVFTAAQGCHLAVQGQR